MLNKRTEILKNADTKTSTHCNGIIGKPRVKFPGIWLASLSGGSPDYWTHGFLVKAFSENFNLMSYYVEDIMVL